MKCYHKYFPLNNVDKTISQANKKNYQKLKKIRKSYLFLTDKILCNDPSKSMRRSGYLKPLLHSKTIGKMNDSSFGEDWKNALKRDQIQRKNRNTQKMKLLKFMGDFFFSIFHAIPKKKSYTHKINK